MMIKLQVYLFTKRIWLEKKGKDNDGGNYRIDKFNLQFCVKLKLDALNAKRQNIAKFE